MQIAYIGSVGLYLHQITGHILYELFATCVGRCQKTLYQIGRHFDIDFVLIGVIWFLFKDDAVDDFPDGSGSDEVWSF